LLSGEARRDDVFNGAVGQTTSVEGAFPAQFQLDLLEPPPDDVLGQSSTGERVAIGSFVALDPAGAPFELDLQALTRVKGGHAIPPFAVAPPSIASEGVAFLTSSAANEDAQESDALSGSFFTHYLVSGLARRRRSEPGRQRVARGGLRSRL
jgi:hypothetical protein